MRSGAVGEPTTSCNALLVQDTHHGSLHADWRLSRQKGCSTEGRIAATAQQSSIPWTSEFGVSWRPSSREGPSPGIRTGQEIMIRVLQQNILVLLGVRYQCSHSSQVHLHREALPSSSIHMISLPIMPAFMAVLSLAAHCKICRLSLRVYHTFRVDLNTLHCGSALIGLCLPVVLIGHL